MTDADLDLVLRSSIADQWVSRGVEATREELMGALVGSTLLQLAHDLADGGLTFTCTTLSHHIGSWRLGMPLDGRLMVVFDRTRVVAEVQDGDLRWVMTTDRIAKDVAALWPGLPLHVIMSVVAQGVVTNDGILLVADSTPAEWVREWERSRR